MVARNSRLAWSIEDARLALGDKKPVWLARKLDRSVKAIYILRMQYRRYQANPIEFSTKNLRLYELFNRLTDEDVDKSYQKAKQEGLFDNRYYAYYVYTRTPDKHAIKGFHDLQAAYDQLATFPDSLILKPITVEITVQEVKK